MDLILRWCIQCAGVRCKSGVNIPGGITVEYALHFRFQVSNNEAEYEALLAGLHLVKELGAEHININSDSQLVVNQVTDKCQARGQHMTAYVQKVKGLLSSFRSYTVIQIPSTENT